jgi:hypothetical protein
VNISPLRFFAISLSPPHLEAIASQIGTYPSQLGVFHERGQQVLQHYEESELPYKCQLLRASKYDISRMIQTHPMFYAKINDARVVKLT